MDTNKTPVLVLAFNRPNLTRALIIALSKVQPERIYFAVDGPRAENERDLSLIAEVKSLLSLIDWDCEVRTLFRTENFGLKKSVIDAIDWVFAFEEQAIILEDDCHPIPEFFEFCADTLAKYANDDRIMQVSGSCFVPVSSANSSRYYFSAINDIWGWATWKRAWDLFEREVPEHDNPVFQEKLTEYFEDKKIVKWFTRYVEEATSPSSQVWSTQWTLSLINNSAYAIVPQTNLVVNLGFTTDATHMTNDAFRRYADFEPQGIKSNLNPGDVVVNRILDSERFSLIEATDLNLRKKVLLITSLKKIMLRMMPAILRAKIRSIKSKKNV
jgi:hypothetical protein